MRLILLLLVTLYLFACASQPTSNANNSDGRVAQNKEAAAINIELGANYIANGEYEIAEEKLQRAFQQDPQSSVARWTYAILKEQLKQPKIAEIYYKEALKINPKDSKGQNGYASFLCRNGRYQEADRHFKKALSDPLFRARAATNLTAGVDHIDFDPKETLLKSSGCPLQTTAQENRFWRQYPRWH